MLYLKMTFPFYDGIIAPSKLPNVIDNGFHHTEIGVFDKDVMRLSRNIPHGMPGGAYETFDGYNNEKPKMLIASNFHHPYFDFTSNMLKEASKYPFPEKLINKEQKQSNVRMANRKTRKARKN